MDMAQHAEAGGPWKQPQGLGEQPGSLPPCRRGKGLAGGCMQRACCFSWSQGTRETQTEGGGGDKRGLGDGGEGASLPSSSFPPLPGSASSPSSAHRTSGDFPFPSFHLSIHSLQGAAVLSSNPALCVLVLVMGTNHPRALEKSCPFHPRPGL